MKSSLWIACAIVLSFALGIILGSARASSNADGSAQRVTGIGGVFFKSQDPAKLADWYRVHLGIASESGGTGAKAPRFHPFEWKETDDPAKTGVTVWTVFPESSKYFDPSHAPFMINYRVANLERLLAQLKSEGVTVDDKIDDEPNGRFGWAMDPEGNRIELWQPAEK
jgi:catechol 2,3-dioxygenase-like lactoylglutathione lyase family enzyme